MVAWGKYFFLIYWFGEIITRDAIFLTISWFQEILTKYSYIGTFCIVVIQYKVEENQKFQVFSGIFGTTQLASRNLYQLYVDIQQFINLQM